MIPIAEACTVAEMLAAYRARMAMLQVTMGEVGSSLDMANGQMAKIFSTNPHRRSSGRSMGPLSFQSLNTQLGVKWIMVEDPTTMKYTQRIKKAASRNMLNVGRQEVIILKFTRKHMRKIGKLSAAGRMKKMSRQRRQQVARMAARIRWNDIKAAVAKRADQ